MKVVLYQPDIPWNTGNIGRTCVATETELHLIGPLGFDLDDKQLRRAGLDYWAHLRWVLHHSWAEFVKSLTPEEDLLIFSRFAQKSYWDAPFNEKSVLVFGSETSGLPDAIKDEFAERLYRIPTTGPVRSLNLSSSVAIVLFESLRKTCQRKDGSR